MSKEREAHYSLLMKIVNSIQKSAKKAEIKIETAYSVGRKKIRKIGEPDILAIIEGTLYIFEVKIGVNEKAAYKKLKKYVEDFSNFSRQQQIKYKISYSNIKAFWVTEKYNIIVSLQTDESFALDPTFLEEPLEFLENN